MRIMILPGLLLLAALLTTCFSKRGAAEITEHPQADSDPPVSELTHAELGARFFQKTKIKPEFIESSPLPGFVQVGSNADLYYLSNDGRFVIRGAVFDLEQDLKNVTQQRIQSRHAALLAEHKPKAITFRAENERTEVYVFTDSSCGYCARIHSYIPDYNQQGITVHYLAFPRGGKTHATSFQDMEKVWCAEDQNEAFNELLTTQTYSGQRCSDNPVLAQYRLGEKLGVRGTPAIFTVDGVMIPGAQQTDELLAQLGLPQR